MHSDQTPQVLRQRYLLTKWMVFPLLSLMLHILQVFLLLQLVIIAKRIESHFRQPEAIDSRTFEVVDNQGLQTTVNQGTRLTKAQKRK